MERLTKRFIDDFGQKVVAIHDGSDIPDIFFECEQGFIAADRLATYEEQEEQKGLVRVPCKVGDMVWELCQCEDGIYRIFPMTVKVVSEFGELRQTKEGIYTVWNFYAESDYTYSYKMFSDIGETVFLTSEEAEKMLRKVK